MITIADEVRNPALPNWENFSKFLEKTPYDLLRVSHTTVRTRLSFARMHLSILRQAENNSMKRAMCEDIIINLVSSLEAIAHVLNSFYGLDIQSRKVAIDHKSANNEKRHLEQSQICLRCRLKKVNTRLSDALDELLKTGSPVEHWYQSLVEYRNQIMHRQHIIAHQTLGVKGYFLPDDSNIMTSMEKPYFNKKTKQIVYPNYAKKREIKKYAKESYVLVTGIVELIYLALVEDKEQQKTTNRRR